MIWIRDWRLGLGIRDWDWGFGFGIGNSELGIGDLEYGLCIGTGDWDGN